VGSKALKIGLNGEELAILLSLKSAASTLGEGRMPLRMPYALNEATTNSNYPGNVVIYTPVGWDVK